MKNYIKSIANQSLTILHFFCNVVRNKIYVLEIEILVPAVLAREHKESQV